MTHKLVEKPGSKTQQLRTNLENKKASTANTMRRQQELDKDNVTDRIFNKVNKQQVQNR